MAVIKISTVKGTREIKPNEVVNPEPFVDDEELQTEQSA